MRAIDADALMEHKYITNSDGDTIGERWYVTFEEIESAPTIEPERKKGKWVDGWRCKHDGTRYWYRQCDQCLHERDDCDTEKDTNYCPNCGADMRGEQE